MRLQSPSLTLRLKPREILNVPSDRDAGVSVCVTRGSVWITEDRRPDDIVLERGQCHAGGRRASMLIYGLEDAELRIDDVAADRAAALPA